MSTVAPELVTLERFPALPDDGVERDLIGGRIVIRGEGDALTRRNRFHSVTVTRLADLLERWLDGLIASPNRQEKSTLARSA